MLAARGSGFEEQIQKGNKNGFLFTPNNHKELAKKIIKILNMPKSKLNKIRKNARKRTLYFDNKNMTNRLLKYYEKLLKNENFNNNSNL